MKKLVFLLPLLLWLISCTKYIYITRTDPPEIILDKQQNKVAFINRYDYTLTGNTKERPYIAFQTGINEFGKALSAYSQIDSLLVFSVADTLCKKESSVLDTDNIISKDTVLYLCKLYNSNLLLILDSLNFDFTYEIEVSESSDGKKSRQAVYYLRSFYYVSLYDSSGLIKRTYLGKSLEYATRPVVAWIIPVFEPKNLVKATKELKTLANESGSEYIGMFLPSTTKISEDKLYTGKIFAESNTLIFQKKYDKAIELLIKISSSAKSKLAEKAKHNHSVAEKLKKNS